MRNISVINKRLFRKGFTLTEVLTSIFIFSLIMVAVSAFQYNVFEYNRRSSAALNNTYEASRILKTITKELRSASLSDAGAYALLSGATSSVSFFSNADSDVSKEQIRYFLSGTTLRRGVINPTGSPAVYNPANESLTTMVTGVRNSSTSPMFQYYRNTYPVVGAAMTHPLVLTDVRLIKISLNIDTDPNRSPIVRTFSSQVQLRNLKDNL